jgi:glutathionyl-hydroquinone reductase
MSTSKARPGWSQRAPTGLTIVFLLPLPVRHSYPNINRWLKNLYWNNPAFKNTTDFTHIKQHYYWSHPQINPTRVVPLGPKEDIEPL